MAQELPKRECLGVLGFAKHISESGGTNAR